MSRIKSIRHVLLASAAAIALSGPAANLAGLGEMKIVQPAQAANVQISIFYDRLAPHGSWVDHRRYGYVFVPAVRAGWRPYTRGHWVYTDEYGWYWVSDEPFAWAVYHYGRWAYDPEYGWVWVPGNVWGPAWVTWRHGGGHVGWAPIAPAGDGYVYGTPDYYEPPVVEAWVFVPERRFVAVDVHRYVTPIVEVNLFLGKARERHHVHYRDGRAYNPFLPRERVTKIVNQEINIYNITVVESPDEAQRSAKADKNTIQTFQAEIAEEQPKEKPKRVAKSPDEVKTKPKLKEAAKGKPPEDAPPSVAELKPGEDAGKADDKEGKAPAPSDEARDDKGDTDKAKADGDTKTGETEKSADKPQDKAADKPEEKAEEKADKAKDQAEDKAAKQKEEAEGRAEQAKEKAEDKSEKAREQAKEKADKAKDNAEGKAERARERAEEKAKPEKQQKSAGEKAQEQKQAKPKESRGDAPPAQRERPQKQARPERGDKPDKPESRAKESRGGEGNQGAREGRARPEGREAPGPRSQAADQQRQARRSAPAQDQAPQRQEITPQGPPAGASGGGQPMPDAGGAQGPGGGGGPAGPGGGQGAPEGPRPN